MIIPTADFDPLFARDGVPFQSKMIQYIQREFADVLGSQAALLRRPGGLEVLARLYVSTVKSEEERKAA